MLSFSLVAEALTGLIYHRPSGENSKFAKMADVLTPLVVNFLFSVVTFCVAQQLVPKMKDLFLKRGLSGKDMGKKNKKEM